MSQCPNADQLTGLLDERLDDDAAAIVAAHLEDCAACQLAMETLTAERFSATAWRAASAPIPPVAAATEVAGSAWEGSPPGDAADAHSRRLVLESSRRQPSMLRAQPGDRPSSGGDEATPYVPEVDGYDIVGRLGRGGMGIVYRARQRGLDRLVALKMLRGGAFADPEAFARFRIEVRAAARLGHPNIVQVYEVGESRGLPFVSLELLEGGSLESRLAGEPRSLDEAATLVGTLARAIASAHRAGIVHRDLKPANVLFSRDGVAKITDFGLAKRLDEDDGATESGQVMGSPSFMAPEQARGETHAVTPAADVYSLGAILYQTLTGRPPFKGGSALETLRLVVEAEPVAPSRLRPGLARDLETICLKALAKEPSRRYSTADELADDLDRFRLGSPIRARRVPIWERAWKWSRRQPAAAAAIAAAIATVTLGAWIGMVARWEDERLQRIRSDATTALVQAAQALNERRWADARDRLQPARAQLNAEPTLGSLTRRVEQVLGAIERVDGLLQDSRRAEFADVWRFDAGRGGDPRPIRRTVANALARVGRVERLADGSLAAWERLPLPELGATESALVEPTIRELLRVEVEAIAQVAPGEDAPTQARAALALLDRTLDPSPESGTASLRVRLLDQIGDTEAAAQARVVAASRPPQSALAHLALGREHHLQRDRLGAIEAYTAALQLDPDLFPAQLALAIAQLETGQAEAAWTSLTTCVQRDTNLAGLRMLRGVAAGEMALHHLAARSGSKGATSGPLPPAEIDRELASAEADFRAAWNLAAGPSERLAILLNRGSLRTQAGQLQAGLADFEAAEALDPQCWAVRLNHGQALRRLGRVDEAVDQFTAALALAPDEPGLYRARALARLDARPDPLGSPHSPGPDATEAALADLAEAIRLDPPGSPDSAADRARRARLQHRLGRYVAALDDTEAALAIVPDQADAALVRVQSLLALKRHDDVIAACDAAVRHYPSSAELYEIRGIARSSVQDFDGAIADQTHALTLDPARLSARLQRGWSYLLVDAGRPALADFDAVIRREPDRAEAYGGRGFALAMLGQHRAATDDAEALVRRSATEARAAYNAARIYAQAAASLNSPSGRRTLANSSLADSYADRAIALLHLAVERTPEARRLAFARDVIGGDPVFTGLRQFPQFARLAPPRETP